MRLGTCVLTIVAFTSLSGQAFADGSKVPAKPTKTSRTCKFTKGDRKGFSQFFAEATPLPLGSACEDAGSSGVAVADVPGGDAKTHTCKFTTGPRKGQTQYYPDAEPITLGAVCQDQSGSTGAAVRDRKKAAKSPTKSAT